MAAVQHQDFIAIPAYAAWQKYVQKHACIIQAQIVALAQMDSRMALIDIQSQRAHDLGRIEGDESGDQQRCALRMKRQGFHLAEVNVQEDENDQAGRYQHLQACFQLLAHTARHRFFS